MLEITLSDEGVNFGFAAAGVVVSRDKVVVFTASLTCMMFESSSKKGGSAGSPAILSLLP